MANYCNEMTHNHLMMFKHHHIKYLEIDGEDVVCHLPNELIHKEIHSQWLYKPLSQVIHSAYRRLKQNHDFIRHIDIKTEEHE